MVLRSRDADDPGARLCAGADGHDGNRGQSFGIIEAKDLYFFLDAVRLLGPSEEAEGLRDWLRAYRTWLEDSPQGKAEARARNNHGVAFDLQTAAIAAFLGDGRGARRHPAPRPFPAARPRGPRRAQPHEMARR
jgi:hypothetical protein